MLQLILQYVTLAAALVGVIGLYIAVRQVAEVRRSHLFDVYTAVMDRLDSPDLRRARHYVYERRPDELVDAVDNPKRTQADRQMIELLARSMDQLGFLVRTGRVPIEIIAQFYAYPILKSWVQLSPYIQAARDRRGQQGHMWEFENLAINIVARGVRSQKGPWRDAVKHDELGAMVEAVGTGTTELEVRARRRPSRVWRGIGRI